MNKVVLIYATQTDQSKAIAESLNDLLVENQFETCLYDITQFNEELNINDISDPTVFVSSTTGDGEQPETATKLFNKLKKLSADNINSSYLRKFNYAQLGLGDSNYAQFCNGPKEFHRVLQALGATCFFGPFWADDGVGLEQVVEPFKDDLVDALTQYFNKRNNNNLQSINDELSSELEKLKIHFLESNDLSTSDINAPKLAELNVSIEYIPSSETSPKPDQAANLLKAIFNESHLFKAFVSSSQIVTSRDAVKECVNLKFKQAMNDETSRFEYEPGHSIDVVVPNNAQEIEKLFLRLGISQTLADSVIKITLKDSHMKSNSNIVRITNESNITLKNFFIHCVDVRNGALKKSLLRMLAEYCSNEKEKRRLLELSSREGSNQYQTFIKDNKLSLLDVLFVFESCKPPLKYLIQFLPHLAPRAYSLCSTMDNSNHQMEIIFTLVKFDSDC